MTYVRAWGGIHIKNPDTEKYYYVGKDHDPNHSEYVKDPFTMIKGQRVLTYPVPSDWKDQAVHNKPDNITENYAVFFGADQSKTASFALVPAVKIYEVHTNGISFWVFVPEGDNLDGRTGPGYYELGHEGGNNYFSDTTIESALYVAENKLICRGAALDTKKWHVPGYDKPSNLSLYGYYWGNQVKFSGTGLYHAENNPIVVTSPHPADSIATVNTYLQQATADQQRADGVFLSRPEGALSANGVYRFVKAGTAAGSTDPADYNIPEGVYWLVETRSPDGFFAGGKPIRIKVEADPADESKAKLSYAGDSSQGSAEYNSFLHHVVKDGEAITGGPADLKYQNYELYNLPSSGGPGTYVFTTFGTMFLSLAAAHGWNLKKRKRKLAR